MSKESEKNFISKQNINTKARQTPKNLNFEDLTKGKEILWVKKVRKTYLPSKTLTLRQDEHQNKLFNARIWTVTKHEVKKENWGINLNYQQLDLERKQVKQKINQLWLNWNEFRLVRERDSNPSLHLNLS